jgi:hypothetical protein
MVILPVLLFAPVHFLLARTMRTPAKPSPLAP